ncbi:hypothetical protein ABD91_16060 [Lysinibacillus sphaericus]|uniref:hypothetical protein n=1 Tax=Lysinibacillus sphaericus TaxID=1421 RepID=UPI0018CE897C|nr:hypothetical protein [Lysinibacillus sphaericus]MBG9692335.1 hypothetical protein [Lysinibacillus sphaericus]
MDKSSKQNSNKSKERAEKKKKGQALVKKVCTYNNSIKQEIDSLVSKHKKLQATILNLRDTFSFELIPKTTNESVEFCEFGDVENLLGEITEDARGIYCFILIEENADTRKCFLRDWQEFKDTTEEKVPAINNHEVYTDKIAYKEISVLYIGKSEKIVSRLKQHTETGNKNTYSLRLEEFKSFCNDTGKQGYTIKCCWLASNDEKIIPILYLIEKLIHENFLPILEKKGKGN